MIGKIPTSAVVGRDDPIDEPWKNDPPVAAAQPVDEPWRNDPPVAAKNFWENDPPSETPLFSVKGATSILKSVGPNIAIGVLGSQLAEHEQLEEAYRAGVAKGEPEAQTKLDAASTRTRELRAAIEAGREDLRGIQGGTPSGPLRITQGIVQSIAQNAPGIATAVATRQAGPIAAAPAIMAAEQQSSGQAYAEARVPSDPGKQPAPVGESLIHADISGKTEAVFELMPMAKLVAEVGKEGLASLIRNYVIREWKTELPTTAAQDISEWATVEQDMPFNEFMSKLGRDLVDTAIITPFAAGGTAALAKAQTVAGKGFRDGEIGPSGELMGRVTDNYPTPLPTPATPPIATQPISNESQALIDSIDATLSPETISDDQVEVARQEVAAFEKARNAPPREENVALLAGLDEIRPAQELGQSAKSARNAPDYTPNPNDDTVRSQRIVSYSTVPEVETGLTLSQTPLQPGVYVVGQPSTDREGPILQAAADTLEQWRAKFLPERPMLLVNESLPSANHTGWHWTNGNVHAITPAVLRQFLARGGPAQFNANAQVNFFYNLSHEFGHSLVEDRFLAQGLPAELTQALKAESGKGVVSEPTLQALEAIDPARAAVVREYNSVRERVMSGQMTAQEFIAEWMGPAKTGRRAQLGKHDYAMPAEAPALQLIDKILQRAMGSKTPLMSAQRDAARAEYLSLHEYAAEQVARFAYARKWDESSPFNKDSLFAQAFRSLREALAEFFAFLKREGDVAPNVKFAEWLDGLTTTGDRTPRAGKKARAKPAPKRAAKPKTKPVEQLDHNVETVSEEQVKYLRTLLTGLVRNKTLEVGDETYKRLMSLLKAADYSTFVDEIQPMLEKQVRFELDDLPELKAGADLNRMIDLVGYKMYEAGLGNTIIKETLQNSVDAVLDQLKADPGSQAEINFLVNRSDRSITVIDTGKGMTLQDVATKFLQLGAKGKGVGSAGGFGLAKAAFLFGPQRIFLHTVHNGKATTLEATQEQLRAQADLRKTASVEPTDEPNGTTLTVWLPNEYTSGTGEKRAIDLPSSYGLSKMKLLAPITVTWEEKYNDGTPSEPKTMPIGKQFDLSKYRPPVEIKFDWGRAMLYIGSEKLKYGGDHSVLSRGVPQFSKTFYEKAWDPFRRHLIVDIQPTVEAAHRLYPFNLQRENFAPIIEKTDIKALEAYIGRIATRQSLERTADVFSKIKTMKRVAGTTTVAQPVGGRRFEVAQPANAELTEDEVTIADGKLFINNKVVFDTAKATEYSGSMQAPEIAFDDLFVEVQADPKEPLFHNNTDFDPIAWGLETGHEDAGLLLAKLGTVVADFRDFIAEARSLESHKERILKGFAGISLDKGSADSYGDGYAGVNLSLPYTGLFINPLYQGFDVQTTADFIGLMKYTLVHEAAHYDARGGHGDSFVAMEAELFRDIEGMGGLGQFTEALTKIVDMHFDTLQAMRDEYAKSSYTNTGDSLEGESIGSPVGPKGPQEPPSFSRGPEGSGTVSGGLELTPATTPAQQSAVEERLQRLNTDIARAQAGLNRARLRKQGVTDMILPEDFDGLAEENGTLFSALDWAKGLEDALWYREVMLTGQLDNQYINPFRGDPADREQNYEWKVATKYGLEEDFHDKHFFERVKKVRFELDDEGVELPPEGVKSAQFKAWFGDWETDPFRSSKVVTADGAPLVTFRGGASRFGTLRAVPQGAATMPAMLNIKSPFVAKEGEPVPSVEELKRQGYDGIQSTDPNEGTNVWTVFSAEQIMYLKGGKLNFELDFDESQPDGFGAARYRDKFGKWMPTQFRRSLRWVTNLQFKALQLQQLAHLHPDLTDLAYMNEKNYDYNRYKGSLQAPPDRVLAEWSELGKENFAHVNRFLLDEVEGGQLWFDLVKTPQGWQYQPNETTLEQLRKRRIDPGSEEGQALGKLILDAKNALLHQVNEGEKVLKHLLARRYGANQAALTAAFTILSRDIHEVRKRPYFPQGRFGNYVLTVERKRVGAPGYEVVYREAFENEGDWTKAWETASKKVKPDERVRKFELTDTEYVMMSLPQDFIELAVSELGLSEEQRDTLIQITQPIKQDKVLRAYDLTRLGIKGASSDAMRSFANFTWHNANLLAKLKFRSEFNMAIQGINSKLREAQYAATAESLGEVQRLTKVKRYMERTRDFIMAPPNEAHMARAFVSIAYLGFNIKTALVNFYGLVTTWSDITSRLGQVEGSKLFAKALKGAAASVRLTDLNAVRKGDVLSPELEAGLSRAVEEGVLTQSYAYHLAGMANASNLYRMPSRQLLGKTTHHAIDLAMWTFRLAELGARRVTFIAELDIAMREQGLGFTDAYTAAVTATNKLQNDYSLGNRVPFMRGIKTQSGNPMVEGLVPMATIFMSFAQHMAFHAYGGYEIGQRRQDMLTGKTPRSVIGGYTMKIWLLTLMLAGYEGLPGAENLLDLLDVLWKKYGGGKPARQEMRELVRELGGDPTLAARGLGHNVAGFDVSRSLGFGRIVPGTDTLSKTSTDISKQLGLLVLDAAGPTGNMLHWILSTSFGNKPISEGMKRAPGALGNIINAYNWSQDGVRAPSGAKITFDLETGAPRDLTTAEIFGKALGFNPTIVSQNREVLFQQHDLRMYWIARRDRLLDDLWRATWQKDREAIADVNKAIVEFNSEIPQDYKRSLRITPRDVFNSRRVRQRNQRLEERQLPAQRRYRDLYRDVRESFEGER